MKFVVGDKVVMKTEKEFNKEKPRDLCETASHYIYSIPDKYYMIKDIIECEKNKHGHVCSHKFLIILSERSEYFCSYRFKKIYKWKKI